MKLNRDERKIVSKINNGDVYDIPSYLREFRKGRTQTYDMEIIRRTFADDEKGKKYKVLKDGHSLFTSSHSTQYFMGQPIHTPILIPRTEADISDDEWTLCEAKLIDNIPPSPFTYDDQEFISDFQKGALVADDFKDILAFIRLWSYLRRENLVFEVSKPVSQDEISMLYEPVPCKKRRRSAEIKIEWDKCPDKNEKVEKLIPVKDIYQTIPTRYADEFMDTEWKMNEDHLMMCREFLGKKMYPTEASHNFAAHNYQTPDERHRNVNTIVAVAALLISVLSFFYGLLQPSNTYQPALDNLTQQIVQIQTTLDGISTNQPPLEDLEQIYNKLESIESFLEKTENSGVYSEIGELATDIEEIRNMLAKQFPSADSSED